MKHKISGLSSIFSKAIIQPVMFLSVTGLLLTIGVILKMDIMPSFIANIGNFIYNLMMNGGINQLSIIFCIGIATALAKHKKTDAAIVAVSAFMIFLYANNAWLSTNGMLVESDSLTGSGQAMLLGVQCIDMGVFLGIILGCLTGYIFNKFGDIEFPDVVRIYGGSRLAYIIAIAAAAVLAIVMCYIWPAVNHLISSCLSFINQAGPAGLFTYGFLNRFLIPTGMHHLIYMPFLLTPIGGTAEIAGQTVSGCYPILMAEMGNLANLTALDPSVKYMMYGFSKIFGCIGITLAFIKTARPEKKVTTRSLLLPLLFVAVVAGVTEPLDFMFLFASPLLWVVHSILDGLFQVIIFLLGARLQLMSGVLNAIPMIIAIPAELSKWYITLGVGLVSIFVWYVTFVFLIRKFNLKTPGREEDEEEQILETVEGNLETVSSIIEGLGGKENIVTISNCFTRLRIEVKDPEMIDEQKINQYKNQGIMMNDHNVQIIIGMKVQGVCEKIRKELHFE